MEDAQRDDRSAVSPTDSKFQLKTYPVRWDVMILLLAVVGGSVDAVVVRAFDALPGPQTGNTVLLGVALAGRQLPLIATRSASPIGYLLGVALGQLMIVKHRGSRPWPSAVGPIQIVELMFLVALLVFWRQAGPDPTNAIKAILVAISAIAMGIQGAAVLDLPAGKPTTTYITGMLTTFVTQVIQLMNLTAATTSDPPKHQAITPGLSLAGPWIYGLTWLVYLIGAVAGSGLFTLARENALILPIAVLTTVIFLGLTVTESRSGRHDD